MTSWFGNGNSNKSSPRDVAAVKPKKPALGFLGKLKIRSSEKDSQRRLSLEDRRSPASDGTSPTTPYPLPCAPSSRTVSCPSLPLPPPTPVAVAVVVEDEFDFHSGSGSTSSAGSQESSLSAPPESMASARTTLANASQLPTLRKANVVVPSRYSNLSPRRDARQSENIMVPNSPRRGYQGSQAIPALLRNGVTYHSESPARSPRGAFDTDQLFNALDNTQKSAEQSPVRSPKFRSPVPSPRVRSGAVSPMHARASFQEQGQAWYGSEFHPLPLPPSQSSSAQVSSAYSSIPRSPERFINLSTGWRKGSLLGSGTFGHVYSGFHSESGQSCAIKEVLIIADSEKSTESARQLMQEVSLLSKMKHPNIVQYYGSEMVDDRLFIYLEFMSNGSIHNIIQQYGPLSESCIRVYTRQILLGLSYLHGKNTVHRDIKGANILVDKGGEVKLADFGMAKHVSAQSFLLSFKGSPYWMAPEVIKNKNGYDCSVDIWSLGCTVLEMATGKPPWSEFEGIAAVFKIGNSKEIPAIPEFLSGEAKMFIRSCLQRDPQRRPTAGQLLDHPFVRLERSNSNVSELLSSAADILESISDPPQGVQAPKYSLPSSVPQMPSASYTTPLADKRGVSAPPPLQKYSARIPIPPKSPRRSNFNGQVSYTYTPGTSPRHQCSSAWDEVGYGRDSQRLSSSPRF